MRRDAARYADADRGDLRGPAVRKIDPDPRLPALRPRRHAVASKRVAKRIFDRADVGDEIRALGERRDRIPHELARAVVRDVASAIDAIDRRPVGTEDLGADKKMIRGSAPSDRVDGIVLEKQETLIAALANACRDRFLHPPRVEVRNASQPCRVQRATQDRHGAPRDTRNARAARTRRGGSPWSFPRRAATRTPVASSNARSADASATAGDTGRP